MAYTGGSDTSEVRAGVDSFGGNVSMRFIPKSLDEYRIEYEPVEDYIFVPVSEPIHGLLLTI